VRIRLMQAFRYEHLCPDATPITSWLHSEVKSNECRSDALFAATLDMVSIYQALSQSHSYSFL
jgi:hypothetical protein